MSKRLETRKFPDNKFHNSPTSRCSLWPIFAGWQIWGKVTKVIKSVGSAASGPEAGDSEPSVPGEFHEVHTRDPISVRQHKMRNHNVIALLAKHGSTSDLRVCTDAMFFSSTPTPHVIMGDGEAIWFGIAPHAVDANGITINLTDSNGAGTVMLGWVTCFTHYAHE